MRIFSTSSSIFIFTTYENHNIHNSCAAIFSAGLSETFPTLDYRFVGHGLGQTCPLNSFFLKINRVYHSSLLLIVVDHFKIGIDGTVFTLGRTLTRSGVTASGATGGCLSARRLRLLVHLLGELVRNLD